MTVHVTATRPLPHGHRHTAQPPLAGSRAGSCDESCARLCRHLWPWELTKALGPRALSAALGPLAPTATPSLWPVATLSSWPTPFVNHGRWRPSSLGGPWRPWRPRPLAASDLRRPLAHGAPLATIGYQGVVVIRNGRVIEPIVRGGGHGGRGSHSDLGGMSWWCGGMGWKWCGKKAKGHEGMLGVDATGWPTPQGKARRGVSLLPRQHVSDFLGRNIWNHILWISLGRGNSSTPLIRRLCRTWTAPCSTPLVWLLWVTWVPSI